MNICPESRHHGPPSELDDYTLEAEDTEILEHLESIQSCHSIQASKTTDKVLKCLRHADACGMFDVSPHGNAHVGENDVPYDQRLNNDSPDLETIWRDAYDKRRDVWKKKVTTPTDNAMTGLPIATMSVIQDGALLRHNAQPSYSLPSLISNDMPLHDPDKYVNISDIIKQWTLNDDQAAAFGIIAEHSILPHPEPLRMYLAGSAGTGKSRVINALKDFFQKRNQPRRFRLCSYMGVAARNISGMTLHAALCMGGRKTKIAQSKTVRDRVTLWEGVDYLFIDEVSMIGCRFLCRISEALNDAKGNTNPFGNINIIFAGDFAQLPPVGDSRLFSHIDTHNVAHSNSPQGQTVALGKLLWLSITTVIILRVVMRQCGEHADQFVDLLNRLREGRCTKADFKLLNTRIISNNNIDFHSPPWKYTPIIVSDNATKDALNERCAAAFAAETGQQLHWYYATDKRGRSELVDDDLKSNLYNLHSGQTSQRLGKIPLVRGMPVLITQNFDVDGGIVNGSRGTLQKIRY
jgi:hypothetical protein